MCVFITCYFYRRTELAMVVYYLLFYLFCRACRRHLSERERTRLHQRLHPNLDMRLVTVTFHFDDPPWTAIILSLSAWCDVDKIKLYVPPEMGKKNLKKKTVSFVMKVETNNLWQKRWHLWPIVVFSKAACTCTCVVYSQFRRSVTVAP